MQQKLHNRHFFLISLLVQVFVLRAQTTVDVMTFNVWQEGTMVTDGVNKIKAVIAETDPDIVCFSEVRNYNGEDWTTSLIQELAQDQLIYHGGFVGGDVSLISKYPIVDSMLIYDKAGSVARFDVDIDGHEVVVGCAHLDYTHYACYLPRGYNGGHPNWALIDDGRGKPKPFLEVDSILLYNDRSERDEQVAAFLEAVEGETVPVIFSGDFNEPSCLDWTPNTATYFGHQGLVIPWPVSRTLADQGFVDAYRKFFPDEKDYPGFTWPAYINDLKTTSWTPLADERERIDYIFYKGNDMSVTDAAMVGPKKSYVYNIPSETNTEKEHFVADHLPWPSDHKAVMVKLRLPARDVQQQSK